MVAFIFLVFITYVPTLTGCHWPNTLQEIEQKIFSDQQNASNYIIETAKIVEDDNDPFYQSQKLDFLVAKSILDAQIKQLKETPVTHPERICSPDTSKQIYSILNINEQAIPKPILINKPGIGLNSYTIAHTAIFVDVPYFKQNIAQQYPLICYSQLHEYEHFKKHQADISLAKKMRTLKIYVENAQTYAHIPPDKHILFHYFKQNIANALKQFHHACEFGADFGASCRMPLEHIATVITWYQQMNFAKSDSHPSSNDRISLFQKVMDIRKQNNA